MKKRTISITALIAYIVILIKVMVFKDVPLIKVGTLMLNFGGTQEGVANFIPFKTILPYLFGDKGLIIGGINLVGNIILLVPVGIVITLISRQITWKKIMGISIASGLLIEILQVILKVGIFDIDDVILNALGVMIGYWMVILISKWIRAVNKLTVIIVVLIMIVIALIIGHSLYNMVQAPSGITPIRPTGELGSDPCNGTGGNGEIVDVGNNQVILKQRDDNKIIVNFGDEVQVETVNGTKPGSSLQIGDRITLVGDMNSDGTFNASTIVLCKQ